MQPTFESVFTFPNLLYSAEECMKGVRWKHSIQSFEINMLAWCSNLHYQIHSEVYKSKGFTEFYINERGKTRFIQSVHISERVVQKTLTEYGLKPILTPSLIYDNGASLEGKGTDFAILRFREHLRWHYVRYGLKGGILIGDFHDFFHSIDHEILLFMLWKKISDDRLYNAVKYFVSCFFGDKGIGLGSEISQICAIFYPNKLDHVIKEKFRIHGYGRYMDDFYVISEDVGRLKEILKTIKETAKELKLTLNENKTVIYQFKNFPVFTFLKCRTSITDTGKIIMRNVPKNYKSKRHLIKKQSDMLKDGMIDMDYALRSYQTWEQYALHRKQAYKSAQNMRKYFKEVTWNE